MFNTVTNWLWQRIVDWLNKESKASSVVEIFDFDQLLTNACPADVVLVEGRAHVSEVIKVVTLSPWTHVALVIGSLNSINDSVTRKKVSEFYQGDPSEILIIESLLGFGTVINPLNIYRGQHLRLCRAINLPPRDQTQITAFAVEHLGLDYDVRQLLDLARLMFPYGILPRKWRSTLFAHNAGKPTQIVCSSMIARCFQHVQYPVLPIIRTDKHDQTRFYQRNFRLFVPADFDYSPFFDVIKFPSRQYIKKISFNRLPWCDLPAPDKTDPAVEELVKTPSLEAIKYSFSHLKIPFVTIRRQP
jgi:hypothetical protein